MPTDRRSGLNLGAAFKPACYVASTGNLALSSTQVIDGLPVGSTTQRVLVKDQTDATENGIYNPSALDWKRAKDMDGTYDAVPGTLVYVDRGTEAAGTLWVLNSSSTSAAVTIAGYSTGDNLTWSKVGLPTDGAKEFPAPVFDDYLVSGLAIARGANAPDLVEVSTGLFLYGFAGTGAVVEQGFWTIHILHGIKAGSSPTIHVHWMHNSTEVGNVEWQIDWAIAEGYTTGTYPAKTTVSTIQSASTAYVHHITDDDDMTITSTALEPDAVLIGRIYRDPGSSNDTLATDAYLIQIDMHYERDKIGTPERNRPFTGF